MRVRIIALLVSLFAVTGAAHADEVVDGRIGPGALYRIVVPTDDPTDPTDAPWNGNLLLYAHGFVSALEPVALPPDGDPVVSLFAPFGYAVAVWGELLRERMGREGWRAADAAVARHLHLEVRRAVARLYRGRVDGRADRNQAR